jgi:AcrR family transcriptional regulator
MAEEITVKRGRGGRPSAGQAGDVEARLLAAATRLFLERGYDGTSCDQVAMDAGAGKASIYARYANKGALFSAVVDSMLRRSFAQDKLAADMPLAERLSKIGISVLSDALQPDALALLRLVVADLPRFANTNVRAEQFWEASLQRVAAVIALRTPHRGDDALGAARQFVDLVVMPPLMRALLGEPAAQLMAAAPLRIDAAIAALEASGALENWT